MLLLPGASLQAGGQKGQARPPARPMPIERGATEQTIPATPIDEFERMSPEEQQQALARLPADQRKRVEDQLRKFNQLPPEQRQALNNLYSRLHQLPERQQESVHKAIDRFSKLPMERQQVVREQLRSFAALPGQDRAAHLRSQAFKQGLSRKEQGIVRDMLPLFIAN